MFPELKSPSGTAGTPGIQLGYCVKGSDVPIRHKGVGHHSMDRPDPVGITPIVKIATGMDARFSRVAYFLTFNNRNGRPRTPNLAGRHHRDLPAVDIAGDSDAASIPESVHASSRGLIDQVTEGESLRGIGSSYIPVLRTPQSQHGVIGVFQRRKILCTAIFPHQHERPAAVTGICFRPHIVFIVRSV